MVVSTRADSVAVAVVEIAEAMVIGMVVTEVALAEVANRVVAASEAVAAAEVVVARNVKEIGPAEIAAIRTLPGETSAIGVRLRKVMVPLEAEVAAAVVLEAVVVAEDRSAAVQETAVEAVVVDSVVVIAMEDMAAVVVVPCVEATEIATSDNGRTKPELVDIPD